MIIATWNVNSIRSRVDRVVAWLERTNCDVLAIQETKCKQNQFPVDPFTQAGYQVAHHGVNQWNGVAIISRIGLGEVTLGFPGQPGFHKHDQENLPVEPRAIGATCGSVRLWSVYVPNGRELSDPHYEYKLAWLEAFTDFLNREKQEYSQLIAAGDWNIAPQDEDVWDIDFFDGKTHVSVPEREKFTKILASGFSDPIRAYTPGEYTYWDYTQGRFHKKEGMRIDFLLLTQALIPRVVAGRIDREERKGAGASDHAPVIVQLDL